MTMVALSGIVAGVAFAGYVISFGHSLLSLPGRIAGFGFAMLIWPSFAGVVALSLLRPASGTAGDDLLRWSLLALPIVAAFKVHDWAAQQANAPRLATLVAVAATPLLFTAIGETLEAASLSQETHLAFSRLWLALGLAYLSAATYAMSRSGVAAASMREPSAG